MLMQRIDILLKASRLFIGLIGLMVGISLYLIVFCLDMVWPLKMVLMVGVLIYGGWVIRPNSIMGLQLMGDGTFYLRSALGMQEAKITGDSTVTTLVCVLRFKVLDGRWKRSCVIFRDSVSQEVYRQLLVWLRCFGTVENT